MSVFIRKKNNSYQAVISYKNSAGAWKTKSKQGFKTKRDAKEWGQKTESTLIQNTMYNMDSTDMTVEQAKDIFLEYKKTTCKPATVKRYDNDIKVLLYDFYKVPVCKIVPIQLTLHINKVKKQNNKSYHITLNTLRIFFNFCIKHLRLMRDNPVLEPLKNTHIDNRIKFITKKMYYEILDACPTKEKKLFVKIAYNTGMRKSEIQGLKQSDIKDCVIRVDKQRIMKDSKTPATLKTYNGYRDIPIPLDLYKEIKAYKIMDIEGYIFPKHVVMQYILENFNTSMHCFRHTFATNLVKQKINFKIAADLVGDTLETFIKTYVETDPDEKEKVFKQIQNL